MRVSRLARTMALGIFLSCFIVPLAGCLRSFEYGPNSTGATSNTTLSPLPNMTGSPAPNTTGSPFVAPNTTATPFVAPNTTVAPVPNTTALPRF